MYIRRALAFLSTTLSAFYLKQIAPTVYSYQRSSSFIKPTSTSHRRRFGDFEDHLKHEAQVCMCSADIIAADERVRQREIASTTQAADSAHTVQHGAHNVQQDSHDAQNLAAVIVKSEAGDRGPTLPLAAATAATVAAVVVHNELAVYSLATRRRRRRRARPAINDAGSGEEAVIAAPDLACLLPPPCTTHRVLDGLDDELRVPNGVDDVLGSKFIVNTGDRRDSRRSKSIGGTRRG